MATSLYDLSVATYLQTLSGVAGYLERGLAHFEENNTDPNEIVETRLYPDMLPFRFQIKSIQHHSLGAIEGMKKGVFGPPDGMPEGGYAEMQAFIAKTRETLQAISRDEVDSLAGKDVAFEIGGRKLPFTAENFVMSFSMPNFYFHAATAYDILRHKGVPLGKRDFMGQLRMKAA
ncbi:MAG TPA: DUF1993 domain-containing protein [Caulobacteraceae bacterium]|jgi:hypothetical protein|nr:DUF1993 domain-containing protein [Caulobacteraceae bacterium]